MSKSFWLDSKASVILLPSGKQGQELFDLACNWAEVGLIGPALWLRPEAVRLIDGQPPLIEAEVIGVGPERELASVKVDLFEQLARETLNVVRFVKVRSSSANREFDEQQDQVVALIEDYLGWALPSPDKRLSDRDERQVFEVINLVCAPTEFKVQKRLNWMTPGRGVTILAAPEDRANPWTADAFIRDNKKFRGFTLMHLASCAGIWNGLPIGTLDLFQNEKSSRDGIWIARTFVSGVLTDGLARRVAAGVLVESADSNFEPPLPPLGTSFIEDENLDSYISTMVKAAFEMDSSILEYRQPQDLSMAKKLKIGVIAQLKSYFVFSGQKSAKMPYWVWMWTKRRFAKAVERELQGDDGKYEVGLGLEEPMDIHDKLIMSRYAAVKDAEDRARISMHSPVHLGDLRSTPSLWQGLRELVFGSLDAGFDIEKFGFAPLEGGVRPIFRKVSNLFQSVDDTWQSPTSALPDGVPAALGWQDLSKAAAVETTLRSWVSSGSGELDQATKSISDLVDQIAETKSRLEQIKALLVDAQIITIDDDGTEVVGTIVQATQIMKARAEVGLASADADDSSAEEPTQDVQEESAQVDPKEVADLPNLLRDYKRLVGELKALDQKLEVCDADSQVIADSIPLRREVLDSFETWRRSNERSFLWQMHSATQSKMSSVDADLSFYENRLANISLPDAGTLIKLRKRFHRAILIAFSVITFLTVIAINALDYYREQNPQETVMSTGEVLSYAGAFALSLLFAFLARYHRGWSKFEREVDLILGDLKHVSEGNRICRQEKQRLTLLYRQTLEWLELMAKALANPWAVRPKWLESGLKNLDLETLPYAMRIAQADQGDAAALEKLRVAALTKMAQKGWRYKAFEQLVEQVSRVSGTSRGLSIELLDRDLPHSSNNARRSLQDHLTDSLVQERVAVSFLKPMIQDLQGEAMTTARPNVLQVEDDPLEALRSDIEGIELVTREVPWTTFLSHTLTLGDERPDPVTPLSVMSISQDEIQGGVHESVSSFAIMPERVSSELSKTATKSLNVKTYSDKVARPLDSVVRVDIAGPISYEIARLWATKEVAPKIDVQEPPAVKRGIRRGIVD